MKDLIIISDQPITYESCAIMIKDSFKNLILRSDNDEILYMKKSGSGFEIWFSPEDVLNDPNCCMDDTVDRCPNKTAFLTNLSYTSKYIAKKMITVLKPFYGRMWIQSDEPDDWFGTADEFINIYCKNS